MLISSQISRISGSFRIDDVEIDRLTTREELRIEPSAESAIGSGTEFDMSAILRLSLRDDHGKTTPSGKDIRTWQLAYQRICKDGSRLEIPIIRDGLKTLDSFHNALTIVYYTFFTYL